MSEDFHKRQQEVAQRQRQFKEGPGHTTMETWRLEQQSAHDGVPSPMSEQAVRPGFWARLKRMLGMK